jgi:UDP-N-acetylglucosamine pyrophosphorylase
MNNILEFLQFVDIAKGSIQLGNETYYRHQVCMFLTLNDRGNVKINCIIMPSYSDIQDGKKIFKLNVMPYSIEWLSKCNETGA